LKQQRQITEGSEIIGYEGLYHQLKMSNVILTKMKQTFFETEYVPARKAQKINKSRRMRIYIAYFEVIGTCKK